MTSLLDTGKAGYDCRDEFERRTAAAVKGERSEWGDPAKLFQRDAVEVLNFVTGDYQVVAPILAGLRNYRLLDLGCGYGRLAPLLAAFNCAWYVGFDRCEERVDRATQRYARYDSDRMIEFETNDILAVRCPPRWDVVWTSNVLQHLTVPDKLRLVEVMKASRAQGGICLLREEEIWHYPRFWCEHRYARPEQARHMIPVDVATVREAFRPLEFVHLGPHVYMAAEE